MYLPMANILEVINHVFKNKEPWQIAAMTSTATLTVVWLWTFICQDESKYCNIEGISISRQIIIVYCHFSFFFEKVIIIIVIRTYVFTGLLERGKKQLFRLARYVPSIRDKINKELVNVNETFEKDVIHRLKEASFIVQLPKDGLKNENILNLVNQFVHLGKIN